MSIFSVQIHACLIQKEISCYFQVDSMIFTFLFYSFNKSLTENTTLGFARKVGRIMAVI